MSEAHDALKEVFTSGDPHSLGLLNLLRDLYPKFEKHIFRNNRMMELVVKSGYNPMNILEYPICGHCETIASPNTPVVKDGKVHERCTCFVCGQHTIDPINMKQWMMEELKNKAPKEIAEIAEVATDVVAMKMMTMALRKYEKVVNIKRELERKKIIMPNGKEKLL